MSAQQQCSGLPEQDLPRLGSKQRVQSDDYACAEYLLKWPDGLVARAFAASSR